MADTQQAEETAPDAVAAAPDATPDRSQRRTAGHAKRLAKQMKAFAGHHGGSAEGQLAHIGRGVTRVALVGADGAWGNLVAPSYESARSAAELAGIGLQDDFDGDLAAKVRTGPYEWSRMAGLQIGGPANPGADN
ncbi:hypothetical protein [Streptomyces varsoviensis]|uniref:Uncharacterized protein n=1 Tax=Streptomyces varsoviensis TaxID=67373 RepID=A0ABR5IT26_9ACTN|nr:hypothetical protein [Streptomyces varsoviensis]KOG57225.1 hypothetical protein ADK38_43035 [Streptomyces varsoviensis]